MTIYRGATAGLFRWLMRDSGVVSLRDRGRELDVTKMRDEGSVVTEMGTTPESILSLKKYPTLQPLDRTGRNESREFFGNACTTDVLKGTLPFVCRDGRRSTAKGAQP